MNEMFIEYLFKQLNDKLSLIDEYVEDAAVMVHVTDIETALEALHTVVNKLQQKVTL